MFRIVLFLLAIFPCVVLGQQPVLSNETEVEAGQANQGANDQAQQQVTITFPPGDAALNLIVEQLRTIAANTDPDEAAEGDRTEREERALRIQKSDLSAQSTMASFTVLISLAAWLSLIIGGIGIWLIIKTLKYTKTAAEATTKTLTIAEDTIEVTRDTARRELRAYMTDGNRILKNAPNIDVAEGDREFLIIVAWENSGQTPATKVKVFSRKHVSRSEDGIPEFNLRADLLAQHATNVGKNRDWSSQITLGENEVRASMAGTDKIVLYTVVEYEDIYGDKYSSETTQRLSFQFDVDFVLEDPDRDKPFRYSAIGTQQGERRA